ncbi:MAG: tetratricopeptide repeat protein [Treponema sp.]|nr:tetratricopeptide repeat protein [Treponema sp.]MCL2244390.1 tetratricopeptide repeat protein [Treponema sp.]
MKIDANGSGIFPRLQIFLLLITGLNAALFAQNDGYTSTWDLTVPVPGNIIPMPGNAEQASFLELTFYEVAKHLADRDFSSALKLFEELNPEDSDKTEIQIIQASIMNSAGKSADAKKIANAIIAKEPDNTEALMVLADVSALEGKDRERRTTLERVIRIDPAHARALTDLGNISLGNQGLRTAAGYFDRALAAEPNNGEALVGRASVYRYNSEPKKAEQLLNQAINEYPQWARPLHERARLYKGAGFLNDAFSDLSEAKRLEPANYWVIVDLGLVLLDMNRKPEALEEFNHAIKIDPNTFIAYVYSAGIKEEHGDYAGAEQDYAMLSRLNPKYYFAFEGLGMLRMKDKKWAGARDAFLDAYRQAPREYSYALLAAINWIRATNRPADPKQFLAQVLRTVPRDSIEYSMIRLFHDFSGDFEVTIKVESERNIYTKARMLFYLASYYDIRGNRNLANRYYLLVQELDAVATIEWRLNEWILAERGIGLRTR